MEKKQAMKWVKALRSGKFKQAQSQLCTLDRNDKPDGYCCLGVLAHINGATLDDIRYLGTLSDDLEK